MKRLPGKWKNRKTGYGADGLSDHKVLHATLLLELDCEVRIPQDHAGCKSDAGLMKEREPRRRAIHAIDGL